MPIDPILNGAIKTIASGANYLQAYNAWIAMHYTHHRELPNQPERAFSDIWQTYAARGRQLNPAKDLAIEMLLSGLHDRNTIYYAWLETYILFRGEAPADPQRHFRYIEVAAAKKNEARVTDQSVTP